MPDDERLSQLSRVCEIFASRHFRNTSAHQDAPLYSELALAASAELVTRETLATCQAHGRWIAWRHSNQR